MLGKPSKSPPPPPPKQAEPPPSAAKASQAKIQASSAHSSAKRKLVGEAGVTDKVEQGGKVKKKKKADKGLLSFNEAEGDT